MKTKERNVEEHTQKATLDLRGANCPSCVYTIEHAGRKIPGIREISVDPARGKIHVTYNGEKSSLERIRNIVQKLGYSAEINSAG